MEFMSIVLLLSIDEDDKPMGEAFSLMCSMLSKVITPDNKVLLDIFGSIKSIYFDIAIDIREDNSSYDSDDDSDDDSDEFIYDWPESFDEYGDSDYDSVCGYNVDGYNLDDHTPEEALVDSREYIHQNIKGKDLECSLIYTIEYDCDCSITERIDKYKRMLEFVYLDIPKLLIKFDNRLEDVRCKVSI